MSKTDSLNKRMKNNYESRSKTYLTRRIPVIMRLDGKAFHTYTRGLVKPFDEGLIKDMQSVAIELCKNIQGAKCAYVQSDEISILITDYDTLNTEAWFDYNVQKMTSVSASIAASVFNFIRYQRAFQDRITQVRQIGNNSVNKEQIEVMPIQYESGNLFDVFELANFDSRVFNIPREEVANYFLARQNDAVKNSISMLAQSLYSTKELHGKHGGDMQEMTFQKGHNWNDLSAAKKRGSFIVKNTYINGKLLPIDSDKHPLQGEIWYQSNIQNQVYPNKLGTLLEWDEEMGEWFLIPIESIRTKWEVVETPIKFNHSQFKQWL